MTPGHDGRILGAMALSLDTIDQLLQAWDERLQRIDENLLALEADPAYQMLIGPGERSRYDGASARRLRETQQELAALFADQGRLRGVIEQARALREGVRSKLWGKDEKLLTIEGLLVGPSVPRGHEPHPLERRSLLDEAPHERSIAPEALLFEMAQRFELARDALLSVWRAWQALEPAVLRVEQRLLAVDEAVARLGLAPGAIEGLVGLRTEVSRLRTQAARDPLGASPDLEARLAPRFQIVEGTLAGLAPRQQKIAGQARRFQEQLVALEQLHREATGRWRLARERLALGPAAATLALPSGALTALAAALEALQAPGGWATPGAIDRWSTEAEALRQQLVRLDQQARALLAAEPELTGRLAARRAQLASYRARGVRIPAEVDRCLQQIEEALGQRPLPVGRAASLMDLLDRAMTLPLALALLLLSSSMLASCRRVVVPTEQVYVVKSAVVPGLSNPTKKKDGAALNGHLGDVFLPQKAMGRHDWEGTVEGEQMERHDDLLLAKRSPRDGMTFLFVGDFMNATAPTAAWLCSTAPRPIQVSIMSCPEVLYRIAVSPRVTVAYPPCSGGPCLLGLAQDDKVSWIDVQNLLSVELRKLQDMPVLVVSRSITTPTLSGLEWLLLRPSPGLPEIQRILIDQVDRGSPPRIRQRLPKTRFTADSILLEGVEREVDATTNQELSARPLREVYRSDGKTLKRE